jgi:hypothetical protein
MSTPSVPPLLCTPITRNNGPKPTVRLDLHGTRAELSGPLELTTVLDIAESLEPTPTTATGPDDTTG